MQSVEKAVSAHFTPVNNRVEGESYESKLSGYKVKAFSRQADAF